MPYVSRSKATSVQIANRFSILAHRLQYNYDSID